MSFLIDLISLLFKGLSRVFSSTTVWKHWFFSAQSSVVQLSHPQMTNGKAIALTRQTFVGKVTSLLFNMLSRLVIAFLPRSKCLLISCLQSPSAVILKPKKIKSAHCFHWEPGSCPISPWKPGLFETDLLQKVLVYRNPFLPEGFSGWNVPSVREGGVIQNSAFSRQWLSL